MRKKLYYNGTIITMNGDEIVKAVLIEDGKILALMNECDLRDDDIEKVDLKGHTMLPGFIDPHSHLTAVGYDLMMVNVKPSPSGECDSVEGVVKALEKALKEEPPAQGEWLMGMGYDESAYEDKRIPNKNDLDKVSKEIPISIVHASGHAAVLNSKALEILGYIGEDYKVPKGGTVGTFVNSKEPNGFIAEEAFLSREIQSKIPPINPQKVFKAMGKAVELYTSFGITTIQDAKTTMPDYELLTNLAKAGTLTVDVVSYASPEAADKIIHGNSITHSPYENHYRVAGFKFFLDGSPQAKTAWLSKPYYKVPEGKEANYNGFRIHSDEEFTEICKKCIENKWQINVHTNGDEAIEQFIRCYSRALECSDNKDKGLLRPVSIHCQTVREDQLERMGKISMLASFFLDHVYYWGDYHYESVLGPERANRISPIKSAIKNNINYTMHQDSPVVKPNPIFAIHNAVNRKTKSGRVLGENQRLTVMEALKGVTINGAYQIFEENIKGSIEIGKLADFVILDKNPLSVLHEELKDIKVLETIKEGKTVFNR